MLVIQGDHPKMVMATLTKSNGGLSYYLISFINFGNLFN